MSKKLSDPDRDFQDLHAWSANYAASLLRDCGWKVEPRREKISNAFRATRYREYLYVKHPFAREHYEFEITSERVYSADIRPLLDNPPMIGDMRVKQEQSDDFTFH